MTPIEEYKEKLKKSGYKLTPQRRNIAEVMEKFQNRHLSIDDIYTQVKKQ
ncbi:MAG TPA: transcriptional repressor, partial [Eubacteriaceae bacterium]|nr:transcriptional repressor [Eubacteriaceae bacterium]